MTASHAGLGTVLERFIAELQHAGLPVDPATAADLGWVWTHVDLLDLPRLHHASAAIVCRSRADRTAFDRAFHRCFSPGGRTDASSEEPAPGADGTPTEARLDHAAMTAEAVERLSRREVRTIDLADLTRWFQVTAPRRPRRPRRRWETCRRGPIDLRRTLARWAEPGADRVHIAHRRRRRTWRPLVLVIDVSGSMRPWVDPYLLLAHAVVRQRPRVTVFSLATRLTDLTAALDDADPLAAQRAASELIADWSSGTRLGDLLGALRVPHRATVVVYSDGWERGDTAPLGRATAALARRAHRLHWVAPAAGRAQYAPKTAGMQAVLPHLSALHAGTTPADLRELTTMLGDDHA